MKCKIKLNVKSGFELISTNNSTNSVIYDDYILDIHTLNIKGLIHIMRKIKHQDMDRYERDMDAYEIELLNNGKINKLFDYSTISIQTIF